jgi:S-adenosyl-L-methionine hydrolase (adenosine-forming)
MRGVIFNLAPNARIVDLTHEVRPQGVADAAFLLDGAAPYFPWGTIHVAVVDPGVGTDRRVLCVRTSRATYLAPDNGLLTRVLERESAARIVSVTNRDYFLPEVSNTFHGRDIFAPVAAHLARGLDPIRLGPEISSIRPLNLPRASETEPGVLSGEIIYIDRFGNLVTNVATAALPEIVSVSLRDARIRGPVCHSYAEREEGDLLIVGGSSGLLEVSVNRGSAQERLQSRRGDPVRVSVRRAAVQQGEVS